MSHSWNVSILKCLIFWNVSLSKCLNFEMSHFWNVSYLKCLTLEISHFWNVSFFKCLNFKMSYSSERYLSRVGDFCLWWQNSWKRHSFSRQRLHDRSQNRRYHTVHKIRSSTKWSLIEFCYWVKVDGFWAVDNDLSDCWLGLDFGRLLCKRWKGWIRKPK